MAALPSQWRPPAASLVAAGLYLAAFAGLGGELPFVPDAMFQFPVPGGPVVVPVVWADGEIVDPRRLTDFGELGPDDVDVEHQGYGCSVEHKLYELQDWLARHPSPEGATRGPVHVQLGVAILTPDPQRPVIEHRVDATGWASWR